MVEFPKYPTSWKIIIETMTDNVVIFVVCVFMYVVISKEEKYVPYGELAGTVPLNVRINLCTRCRTNLCRYNGVQL